MPPLSLPTCPHCDVTKPFLPQETEFVTGKDPNRRFWDFFTCSNCDGVVMVEISEDGHRIWPPIKTVSDELPPRAHQFLSQAIASRNAPAGAVILAASAVDSMLKAKGLTEGKLYHRISQAAEDHLITSEMALWAHEVRLDANDQRHADEEAPLPNAADAAKSIEFAQALGQFLFVLPALVAKGRKSEKPAPAQSNRVSQAPPPLSVARS